MTSRLIQIASLLAALSATAQSPQPAPTDVLQLKTGVSVPCRILATNATALKIEYRAASGVGSITREVPWADVQAVDFAMDDAFRAALASTDIGALEAMWNRYSMMLTRPRHPVGDLGLALAKVALAGSNPASRALSVQVCRMIESTDWNEERRSQARLLRLRLLVAMDRKDEALTEARALVQDASVDPEMSMHAHLLLANTDFDTLKKLEEENPLWSDDDLVRPERERLFHATLDAFLKPSLFHGTLENPPVEGLWGAAQLHHFDGNLSAAANCARDILNLYPSASLADKAKAFLAQNKLPLEPSDDEPETVVDRKKDAPEPADREPAVQRRARYAKPPSKTPKAPAP
jgi:hypothetical protein